MLGLGTDIRYLHNREKLLLSDESIERFSSDSFYRFQPDVTLSMLPRLIKSEVPWQLDTVREETIEEDDIADQFRVPNLTKLNFKQLYIKAYALVPIGYMHTFLLGDFASLFSGTGKKVIATRYRQRILSLFGEPMPSNEIRRARMESISPLRHLALRKIFNPFKWIEFIVALVYEIFYVVSQFSLGLLYSVFVGLNVFMLLASALLEALSSTLWDWGATVNESLRYSIIAMPLQLLLFGLSQGVYLLNLLSNIVFMILRYAEYFIFQVAFLAVQLGLFVFRSASYILECITSPMDAVIKPAVDFVRLSHPLVSFLVTAAIIAGMAAFVIAALVAINPATAIPSIWGINFVATTLVPLMSGLLTALNTLMSLWIAEAITMTVGILAVPIIARVFISQLQEYYDVNAYWGFGKASGYYNDQASVRNEIIPEDSGHYPNREDPLTEINNDSHYMKVGKLLYKQRNNTESRLMFNAEIDEPAIDPGQRSPMLKWGFMNSVGLGCFIKLTVSEDHVPLDDIQNDYSLRV